MKRALAWCVKAIAWCAVAFILALPIAVVMVRTVMVGGPK